MDRTHSEPYFCAGPCVISECRDLENVVSFCTKWEMINGYPEPFYMLNMADSLDGINWRRTGQVCIDYDDLSMLGRPCIVWKVDV